MAATMSTVSWSTRLIVDDFFGGVETDVAFAGALRFLEGGDACGLFCFFIERFLGDGVTGVAAAMVVVEVRVSVAPTLLSPFDTAESDAVEDVTTCRIKRRDLLDTLVIIDDGQFGY